MSIGISMSLAERDRYEVESAIYAAAQAVVWRHAGFTVQRIRIANRWHDGIVKVKREEMHELKRVQAFATGLLSGYTADHIANDLWQLGLTDKEIERAASRDIEAFNKEYGDIKMSLGRTSARAFEQCTQHWDEIVRLAETLLKRG